MTTANTLDSLQELANTLGIPLHALCGGMSQEELAKVARVMPTMLVVVKCESGTRHSVRACHAARFIVGVEAQGGYVRSVARKAVWGER